MGFFDKLKERVGKTRSNFSDKLNTAIKNFRRVDEDFFEELEEILILSDMGMETADKVMEELRKEVREQNIKEPELIKELLIGIVDEIMKAQPFELHSPCVILVVGVNGVGKTNFDMELSNEQWTNDVNVNGFVKAVCFMFQYFKTQGHGHIAAISSVAGFRGIGCSSAYSASKGYQSL